MKIQFLGQNCFLFQHNGITIISDPFYNIQKDQSGFNLLNQKIDYILITHAHGDHVADVGEILEQYPEVRIIAQPEVCGYYNHPNSVDLNFGGSFEIEDLKITMVPASHTSSFPDGTYGGEPAGYFFQYNKKNVYLAGDTGVISDMALFPRIFGEITLAILPIGGHYTMDPELASFAAAELLKADKVLGCHFDTFPPITIRHYDAQEKFQNRGVSLIIPELGAVFEV